MLAEQFAEAFRCHQQGDLARAARLYRTVLQARPDHADSWHLLGMTAQQSALAGDARASIRRAIILQPPTAAYYGNLGLVEADNGDPGVAAGLFSRAVAMAPDFAEGWINLGNIRRQQGQPLVALACYERAGQRAEALNFRALLLSDLGRAEESELLFREAIMMSPGYSDVWINLAVHCLQQGRPADALRVCLDAPATTTAMASWHHCLAQIHSALGDKRRAEPSLRRAIAMAPDWPDSYNDLALAIESPALAERAWRHALLLRPDFAEVWTNLGAHWKEQGALTAAEQAQYQAVALTPGSVQGWVNLANLRLTIPGQTIECLALYNRALQIDPKQAEARHYRGMLRLLRGDYHAGWEDYEWRSGGRARSSERHSEEAPLWQGEPLDGRTILLTAEQGMGDAVMFCRYAPMVADRGGRVILEVHRPIRALLAQVPGVSQVIAKGEARPPVDCQCALMSLPGLFATEISTIPCCIPYLRADPERVARWRDRIGSPGIKIGIAWQGNPAYSDDRNRSVPLAQFAPLARLPGVRLISLQKQHGLDQLRSLPAGMAVEELGDDFDTGPNAFLDSAAVITSLDLLVTIDSALGHLAGAMGCPVWLPIPMFPHWIWMLERSDSPWYPNTRLFRQSRYGHWDDVFAAMADHLRHHSLGQS